jgi:hypothetical protein
LGAGSRFGPERRSAPRYSFAGKAEILEPLSGARLSGQVSQISLNGCYVEASEPLAPRTVIWLAIEREGNKLETWASVANSQIGQGMGIAFFDREPEQLAIIAGWLAEASLSGHSAP